MNYEFEQMWNGVGELVAAWSDANGPKDDLEQARQEHLRLEAALDQANGQLKNLQIAHNFTLGQIEKCFASDDPDEQDQATNTLLDMIGWEPVDVDPDVEAEEDDAW